MWVKWSARHQLTSFVICSFPWSSSISAPWEWGRSSSHEHYYGLPRCFSPSCWVDGIFYCSPLGSNPSICSAVTGLKIWHWFLATGKIIKLMNIAFVRLLSFEKFEFSYFKSKKTQEVFVEPSSPCKKESTFTWKDRHAVLCKRVFPYIVFSL